MSKRLTQKEFIETCQNNHNNKYDYSDTVYTNLCSKITYKCYKHGNITQNAYDHLNGHGCRYCSTEQAHFVKLSSKEDFIKRAREVHGDKYDYSKVDYYNNNTPVIIICPKHGEFEQTPHSHKSGSGCIKCNQITKEDFILKARQKFGWKYDYSKMNYIDYNTKICIIHPEYGEFWQTPQNHIASKSGFIKCKTVKEKSKKETKSEILKKKFFEAVKDREYDYSKVSFEKSGDKITIICPKHGEFTQRVVTHMNGGSCPKCEKSKKYNTKSFIEKAREVHGDKYDYSKVEYVNNHTNVCIMCPEHGEFWQTPNSHLNGTKCPKCYGRNKTTEEWISEAKLVYPENNYSYDKTIYLSARGKLIVTCNKHGDFITVAHNFLRGHGCPYCKESKLERKIRMFLLDNAIEFEYQKRFSWLGLQSLDFYLPDYNIAIECQGEQHFIDKQYFNKRESINERKERDNNKKELCKQNNIKLIYFLDSKFVNYLSEDDEYVIDVNDLKTILDKN